MNPNNAEAIEKRRYHPVSFVDATAKTPKAMATALLRYSAVFRNGMPMAGTPETMMRLHRECMHETFLDHADLEADMIRGKGETVLWVCPEVLRGLRDLLGMTGSERAELVLSCLSTDQSLQNATFTNLDGSIVDDLGGMVHDWASNTLELFLRNADKGSSIEMLQAVFETEGAQSLEDIDQDFANTAAAVGIDHPAEIEEALLRMTGMVDIETVDLGQLEGVDIHGVAYALTLAHVAYTRGLKVGAELPETSLQEGYVQLLASGMIGQADAVANGAARSCEEHHFVKVRFSVHRPEGILAVAAALCGVIEREGEFAAVVAASDMLTSGDLHGLVDHRQAQSEAEIAFVSSGRHSEEVMREILSDHLICVMPPLFIGDERQIDLDQNAAREVCARLTQALRMAYPAAKPITLKERYEELRRRLAA
jgi:hypothetical protein